MAKKQKVVNSRIIKTCDAALYVPLRDLHPFDSNPRKKVDGRRRLSLRKSILELGVFKPFLVWRSGDELIVIGGNQRLDVIHELFSDGCRTDHGDDLPCTMFTGDERQAKLVALRDNNADGEWDYDILPGFLKGLSDDGVDVELSGFDDDVVRDLLSLMTTDAMFEEMFNETSRKNRLDLQKKVADSVADTKKQGEPVQFGNLAIMVDVKSVERIKMAMVAAKDAGAGDDMSNALLMVADAALSVFKDQTKS